ncbi:RNA polymerase sigma factor [Sphingobacterium spiritivorum]|uniref:RNA polymerase sigma factor n=1 Tax=Sphingobacterium spiritivorum ATCC 33861 TaxID=525373 RepID=D7VNY9_SPHSI|nr:RNA polymerase sigma factor [Sphingobacterium spiritivorum]EFK57636.1 RNA polymerase sigma-70 factor [Sphingobacterium spiritivorum ATCC 33861]QQT36321.1 RNA polymerase sigma factor [Sphingobacterium spiritivorum]WQD33061.1 RNA polymerase sigma factor [Sphingobacterium spiritivorum]SUJ18620.1 Sigma-24 [Sphingobacterium spiritivorum]
MGRITLFNEKNLLLKLKNGDRHAFEQLYHFYKNHITGHLFYIFKSEELTQDVTQETFITVWENRFQLHADKSFKSYLYTIATNKAYDLLRKANLDKQLYDKVSSFIDSSSDEIYETLFVKQRSEQLHQILAQLPSQQRLVFQMAKLDGYSYEEIARALGISQHTVNTHIKRANIFLKNQILKSPELFVLIYALFLEMG